jgi:hypothetical protein
LTKGLFASGATLLKAVNLHDASEHGRSVDPTLVRDLPKYLADPLAIFSGEGGANAASYRVVTPKGVVALEPRKDFGMLLTIHPGGQSQVDAWAANGLLHYLNDKPPVQVQGDQSSELNTRGVDTTIALQAARSKGRQPLTKSEVETLPEVAFTKDRGNKTRAELRQSFAEQVGQGNERVTTFVDDQLATLEDWFDTVKRGVVPHSDTEAAGRALAEKLGWSAQMDGAHIRHEHSLVFVQNLPLVDDSPLRGAPPGSSPGPPRGVGGLYGKPTHISSPLTQCFRGAE